ncbi:MAG: alpha-galactosidase [Bacteroidales bacterium]|nr:alpha-galactosidase [Bacteroidales bacterium]
MHMRLTALVLAIILALPYQPSQARKVKKFVHQTVAVPQVEKKVIPIETNNTSLVLLVHQNGQLETAHYGAPISHPEQFLGAGVNTEDYNGFRGASYPATGGRYIGEPALHVKYADGTHNTELYYVSHQVTSREGCVTTAIDLKDYVTELQVRLVYDAYLAEDVLVQHTEILNGGKAPVQLLNYASSSLYLDADDYLLTHFYGAWATDMQMESEVLGHDMKVIESRRGTQATQGNNPSFLLSLNTREFSETSGEVVAGALAWSGNFRLSFEKDDAHRLNVLAGISPFSSAYPLAAGNTFVTPEMIYTYSFSGAGGASRNLHRWARKYGVYGGGKVNPTLLNSWEGAYFTFTTETLLRMMDDAAGMGLEMFVLDDGWFGNDYPRNNDDAGLGDWEVNVSKLPEGIEYLASHAHSKGLKFGIWIEPEMVNPRSNLAQAHPEWVVQSPGREIYQGRNQWVLDLSNPAVEDFVFGIFDRTMQLAPGIDYIKWDCNRVVQSFGSPYLEADQDKFFVDYCQGLYNVMRRIREKYPQVIVQCCSSGGGRVDYGALKYCNEVWTSDNTDGLSRVYMQYATSLIYPACIMGSHVSTVPNHQTGNVTPLKFRFDVACAGRLGLELQPKYFTEQDRITVDRCIASYKQYRDLVFGGDLYRLASPYDGSYYGLMYVSPDKRRAVVFTYCIHFEPRTVGGKVFRLQGLDSQLSYSVVEQNVDNSCWWGNSSTFTGDFLMNGGFNPTLYGLYTSAVFLLEAR